jgi:hypothetical protein
MPSNGRPLEEEDDLYFKTQNSIRNSNFVKHKQEDNSVFFLNHFDLESQDRARRDSEIQFSLELHYRRHRNQCPL